MTSSPTMGLEKLADGLGVLGATACAVHCIALPVLFVLGAAVPTFFRGEGFHSAMLWLVVPSAIVAFSLGCWRHRDQRVLIMGIVGAVGLVLAGTVLHDVVGEAGEKVATLASAALLISAHVRNFKLCQTPVCEPAEASAS